MATPEEMVQTMIDNLPEKTGKSLPDWLIITKTCGLEKHGQIVKILKSDHGVTHGFANLIAAKTLETGEEIDLVAAQYSGAKAGLRPLHNALVAYAKNLGTDVEISSKKSSVSLRRKKQFALITPATKTRIDLGVSLKGEPATERLLPGNAMCSHKVRLEKNTDFDDDVRGWMKLAYGRAG